ncbi:MAG: prepilin-type N-terminal cleavage/methylation domain-containing protein [Methylococcaceae bacterium]|nr:prepilin-type N-terminal cleavage/methylation domain-containing protein [Methylococcaceae bacterium]
MKTSKPSRQNGFSLLEILIAFSILSLSLGIMLNIFSGGVKTAITAEDYTVAVQIAESLVAKAGTEITLKDHQSTGIENDKYHWSLNIRPYTITGEAIDPKNVTAELYKVNAIVEWGDGDDSDNRQLQIATLKLAPKNNVSSQN